MVAPDVLLELFITIFQAESSIDWQPADSAESAVVQFDARANQAKTAGVLTEADLSVDVTELVELSALSTSSAGDPPHPDIMDAAADAEGFLYGALKDRGSSWARCSRAIELAIGPADRPDACVASIRAVRNQLATAAQLSADDISQLAVHEIWAECFKELAKRLPPIELMTFGNTALARRRFFRALCERTGPEGIQHPLSGDNILVAVQHFSALRALLHGASPSEL